MPNFNIIIIIITAENNFKNLLNISHLAAKLAA